MRTLLIATGLSLSFVAMAQDLNPHNGSWQASFTSRKGEARTGKVTIADKSGQWETLYANTRDPCISRAAPIEIESVTADALVFHTKRSQVLAGCEDQRVSVKRVEANKMEGEIEYPGEPGRKITLVRE